MGFHYILNPLITCILWLLNFVYHGILQRNYRKMTWSFSYNSFVKLSLYKSFSYNSFVKLSIYYNSFVKKLSLYNIIHFNQSIPMTPSLALLRDCTVHESPEQAIGRMKQRNGKIDGCTDFLVI